MLAQIPQDIQELIEAVSAYSAKLAETLLESENRVQQWVPANECMVQLFPLSQEAVTVGCDRWYTTKAAWHSKDEAGRHYQHGFDKDGRIRMIRYDTQARGVFVHGNDFIDELILAGESFRGITRYLFSGRMQVSSSFLSWPVRSLIRSDFTYDGDLLVEQRTRYSDIDQAEGTISTNDLEQVYSLTWDQAIPKRNLVDVKSSFGELLYVGYHHRKLLQQAGKTIIAFTLDVDDLADESAGDGLAGQCYSLEMTADFDWEFDRVLFCLPDAVSKITQESDICSTGLRAGGIAVQSVEEIRAVAEQGGKWVWVDAGHHSCDALLSEALQNEIKVLLSVDDKGLLDFNNVTHVAQSEAVAVILCNLKDPNMSHAQATVRTIREATQASAQRIRVLVPFTPKPGTDLIDFINAAGADGVYIHRVDIFQIIPLLNQVGLHSYRRIPLSVDGRHVLTGL